MQGSSPRGDLCSEFRRGMAFRSPANTSVYIKGEAFTKTLSLLDLSFAVVYIMLRGVSNIVVASFS